MIELIRFELIQAVAQRRILAVISLYFLVIAALSWSWLWFNSFVEDEWSKRNIESEGLTGELLLDMVKDQLFERFVGFVRGYPWRYLSPLSRASNRIFTYVGRNVLASSSRCDRYF